MADQKTTKAKTAATKKTAAPSPKTTAEQLSKARADYQELQKSHAAGELVNPRALTHTRKQIARLMTKVNAEKEAK